MKKIVVALSALLVSSCGLPKGGAWSDWDGAERRVVVADGERVEVAVKKSSDGTYAALATMERPPFAGNVPALHKVNASAMKIVAAETCAGTAYDLNTEVAGVMSSFAFRCR